MARKSLESSQNLDEPEIFFRVVTKGVFVMEILFFIALGSWQPTFGCLLAL